MIKLKTQAQKTRTIADKKFMDEILKEEQIKLGEKEQKFMDNLPFKTERDRMVFDRLPLTSIQKLEILGTLYGEQRT